jgi:glycosyltransferase involved in cell wall biosynthesis
VYYSGGPLEKDLLEAGVRIRPLNKRGRWDVLNFLFRLMKVMREERPDILHSYLTDLVTVILKPVLPGTKVVWGIRVSNIDYRDYDWLVWVCSKLECWVSRFADAIISNSHAGRDYHVALGYPAEKTVVIPNGIDTGRFHPNPRARDRIRREWGITEHEILIGLVPMKDHPSFLNVAASLVQERKDIRFVCVGDGPVDYRLSLQELTKTLGLAGYVIWAGARSDVADIYNALDLLVSSSAYGEGFSNVLGEAMACGVPCVVTKIGDSAWVVGPSGTIVPPNDPEAMADAMGRMVTAPRPDPMTIRQRILDHFSIETLVTSTERTLQAVLSGDAVDQPLVGKAPTQVSR